MFTSFSENIEHLVRCVLDVVPKYNPKILDVGGAFGKYALLIKEGIASLRSEGHDLSPDISDIIIDNVDVANYFKQFDWIEKLYHRVYWEDIRKFKITNFYNLVIMIDVIEHLTKDDFYNVLENSEAPILVSTPRNVYFYKEEHYGFEKHITQWAEEDFKDRIIVDYSNEKSLIYLLKGGKI